MEESKIVEVVERAKAEIAEDVRRGLVPTTVRSFSELHDFVDANCYGSKGAPVFTDPEGLCRFWNEVQNRLDSWIKKRRPFKDGLLGGRGVGLFS